MGKFIAANKCDGKQVAITRCKVGIRPLTIAAQFSTKLAQCFGTILERKFEVGEAGSKSVLEDISGRNAAQNLKIEEQLSKKLAQFFDTKIRSEGGWL